VYFCFGTATGRICSDPTDGSIGASSLVCRDWQDVTVFQNIPPGVFFTTVKLAVSINLVMMYPVTMLPASKAIEEALGIKTIIPSIALRLCIIGSMTVTGMALPSFEFLQALTGSLTMFTALSMPPYAYWLLCKDEMGAAHNLWAWFVLVFGLACTVFSTAQTIYNKVEPSG
jgi:solute carrier family 36 (proton-coupled amino acid transporter)